MKKRVLLCMVLLMCMLAMTACGPSRRDLSLKDAGLLPTEEDFPNTRWVCQEIDLYLHIMECGEIAGECRFGDKTFPVLGGFKFGSMSFSAYSYEKATLTEEGFLDWHSEEYIGGARGFYIFDDGMFQLTEVEHDFGDGIVIPTALTFVPDGKIAQTPDTRWYAQEIDLYMDSFSDTENYFKGVLTDAGTACSFEAFLYSEDNTYHFSFPAWLDETTQTPCHVNDFIMRLVYDQEHDVIVGTRYTTEEDSFSNYDGATITFTKVMPE